MNPQKPFITDHSLDRLSQAFADMGEPSFRWRQVAKWIYQKRVDCFDGMRNIPKTCRGKLSERFRLEKLAHEYCCVSAEGDAAKFGFVCNGDIIESVLLWDKKRRTACVSSQLGCGLGCTFCETGKMGLVRNLTLHEILGQIIALNEYLGARGEKGVTNIVFMGMGEALSNFETFKSAVEILTNESGFGLGRRRITVSTAGIIPSIEKLTNSGLSVGLAISLNTYDNEKRNRIMPINKKYPIEMLVQAGQRYARATGADVTFEYVVVRGENDTPEAVDALARMLAHVPCKVNLIPINPSTSMPSPQPPGEEEMQAFADALYARRITVTKRKSRGRDILGACGQLAGRARF
jgi:23S rRNA (adenine2503-C2)-methyltransferase